MNVTVIGAGAVGCYLGARLQQSGHTVEYVGRSEQVAALSTTGLRIAQVGRPACTLPVRATLAPRQHPDLVLLTVKSQDVVAACELLRAFDTSAPVLAVQNGVRGDGLAAGLLGPDRVVGCVAMCAVTFLEPGTIRINFPGWLLVGAVPGANPRPAGSVARLLQPAIPTVVVRNLAAARWTKLLVNLNNGLSAATGLRLADLMRHPTGRFLPTLVMREGLTILKAAGVTLDHGLHGLSPRQFLRDPRLALVGLLQATAPFAITLLPVPVATGLYAVTARGPLSHLQIYGSTWQSLMRNRPTEIEYLNGEIIRLADLHGLAAPLNARIVDAVHQVEATHHFVSVEALWPARSTGRSVAEDPWQQSSK